MMNLTEAFKRQHHIVAFNFFNAETLSGILEAAKEEGKIVIASFGESYIPQMPLSVAAALAKAYGKALDISFVLHLDHATRVETVKEAIDAGFTSVMFDGSKLPLDENIQKTAEVVAYAHARGVSVEGELGYLNKEDGSDDVAVIYTSVEDSLRFTRETQVDALAIAVGNAHGLYKSEPRIGLDRISEIARLTQTPLVLHGSSGISNVVLQEAFERGIRKINVNTELALAASQAASQYIQAQGGSARFEKVMAAAQREIRMACRKFLAL
ncbi:class II fructose-bisphosphate aldolase [Proteiniclasticum sp. BAD-10]|uniref:Class II fructose-bisphosphate aldolase n=1 Tax=Proteiniclasticum sediminis TaxID=2804028 RepID=A0A941CTD3_9CLOT|nr:class II fructose-bisphosphate aldolase [Proteiniclasticum sediminis]MBR0577373.1 class II fructose-bisphosphate aldolase [Proteiniclasticum sediminis]